MASKAQQNNRGLISMAAIALFLLPMMAAATPIETGSDVLPVEHWWQDTIMDVDKDGIQDNIWIAIDNTAYDWIDDQGRIGVNPRQHLDCHR